MPVMNSAMVMDSGSAQERQVDVQRADWHPFEQGDDRGALFGWAREQVEVDHDGDEERGNGHCACKQARARLAHAAAKHHDYERTNKWKCGKEPQQVGHGLTLQLGEVVDGDATAAAHD
jgi:hypothetical protein